MRPVAKLLLNITRSVSFLVFYIQTCDLIMYANFQKPFMKWTKLSAYTYLLFKAFLIMTTASFGIAFEQPHRRVDIMYYCMPRSFEIFWNMMATRKFVPSELPFQNALLMTLCFGIVAFKFCEEEEDRQANRAINNSNNAPAQDRNNEAISGFSLKLCRTLWGYK